MATGVSDFGELLMIIGDLHVPQRAPDLPQCFKELLKTDKIKRVLCTGNVGSQVMLDMLLDISPNLHIVKGDFDHNFEHPEQLRITVGNLRIGLINGYQIPSWSDKDLIYNHAKNMEVDILIYGHSHISDVTKVSGKILINPGTATGAFQPWQPKSIPTFMLLAIQGPKIVVYVYEEQSGLAHVVMSEIDWEQCEDTCRQDTNTPTNSSPLQASQKIT